MSTAPGLLLTGGRQYATVGGISRVVGTPQDGTAVVCRLDQDDLDVTDIFEYVPTGQEFDWRCQNIKFKYGYLDGKILRVVSENQIVEVDTENWRPIRIIDSPQFNDLHSILPHEDGFAVTCSGRDLVLLLNHTGAVRRAIDPTTCELINVANPPTNDWRAANTKPHAVHPNYLFRWRDELWITRGELGDAVGVESGATVKLSQSIVHDGNVDDAGNAWFTSVDGFIYRVNSDLRIDRTINVRRALGDDSAAGWCRGLAIRDGRAFVGISALRETALRKNIRWAAGRAGSRHSLETQLLVIDVDSGVAIDQKVVAGSGLDSIFSVLFQD